MIWSWSAGRDLNWDQLNYHFYAAYQFLDDRLEKDFMAASVQGYLNPLAYVPFYWMVQAQWHSLLIGSVLALLHSTCLWLMYGISGALVPPSAPYRVPLLAACVGLAFLTPVFLVEVGSSFIDVTTAIPVLAGVLLLMRSSPSSRRAAVIGAGALMGCAAGLKLTNAIFGVAAVAFVAMSKRSLSQRVGDICAYAAAGSFGFVLVGGAWSYRLLKEFGSPFFPWFNAWFRSPDFPPFNIVSYRFMPETFSDWLLFPVTMLDAGQRGYTESIAPDGRPLILFVILVCAAIAGLIRLTSAPSTQVKGVLGGGRVDPCYAGACAFTISSYVLWLLTSGNGRYGMPLLLFVGPMIPAGVLALTASRRMLVYTVAGSLLVQGAMLGTVGPVRWTPTEWKNTWFDVEVPERLREESFLYLSLNRQTAAFLAPFLNPASSFVNLVGQVSLAFDRPGGDRLRALFERHHRRIRTLLIPNVPSRGGEPSARIVALQDNLLKSVGLEVDAKDCMSFEMRDPAGSLPLVDAIPTGSVATEAVYKTYFLSCATKPAQPTSDESRLAERRARVDRAFDRLEAACPRVFSPAGARTDQVNSRLRRNYVNSDVELWELDGTVAYEGWMYDEPITLGRLDDIAARAIPIACRFVGGPRSVFHR